MTISEYITKLLNQYDGIKIDTNHVSDGSDKYGLFKSPSRNINNFNDGSYQITEYYQFLARQHSVSASERKEADEWLEDLTYWVDDLVLDGNLPKIDKDRVIDNVSITGCPYPMETKNNDSLFQMSLSITYTREREVY